MNSRIGIVVDGDGDYGSFKKRFNGGYKIVKTDGPRGHTASAEEITHTSRKQVGILAAYECKYIIVVLDFEERTESYNNFLANIRGLFGSAGFTLPVLVAVPNRMIENWYLADIEHLSATKAFLRNGLRQKAYEGLKS